MVLESLVGPELVGWGLVLQQPLVGAELVLGVLDSLELLVELVLVVLELVRSYYTLESRREI